MSVQYKESGTWKNISSSSNNAVDVVADGNMNPITSNAASRDLILNLNVAAENSTSVYDKKYSGNNDAVVRAFVSELKQKADTNDQKISASGQMWLHSSDLNAYIRNGTYDYIVAFVKGTTGNYFGRMTLLPADSSSEMVIYTANMTQEGSFTIGGGIKWLNATWGAHSGHTGDAISVGTIMNGYFTFTEGLRISPTNVVDAAWNEVLRVPGQLVHNVTINGICGHSSQYYLDVRASNNNDNTWSVYFWGQPNTSAQYFDLQSQAIPVLF